MRSRFPCRILTGFLAITLAAAAQDETPTFRSGVQLVELSVSVRDAGGKPVTNLTGADFILMEDGKQRPIDLFSAPATPESQVAASSSLPEGVFSNAPELNRNARGIVMVMMDSLNTCVPDQMQAKRQVATFLRNLPPRQRMALYAVGMQFQVLHDFTEDPEPLIARMQRAAVASAEVAPFAATDGSNTQLLDGRMDTFAQAPLAERQIRAWLDQHRTLGNYAQYDARVRTTLSALEGIARSVEGLPGKKTLIWLSGGFQEFTGPPTMPTGRTSGRSGVALADEIFNTSEEFQQVLALATRAGLTIYTIDSRGVAPQGDIAPGVCDGIHAGEKLANQQALREAAATTGGRAFMNSNDLTGALAEVMDEIEGTYTLGFYVSADRQGGRRRAADSPRAIEVRTRQPGLQVSHRKSYSPTVEPQKGRAGDPAQQALASPVDQTGIIFLAGLLPPQEGNGESLLQAVIPVSQLQFSQKGQSHSTVLRLLLSPRTVDGKALPAKSHTVRATLTEPQMQQARATGLIVRQPIALPANAASLRIVIQEPANGLLGSLSMPLSGAGR